MQYVYVGIGGCIGAILRVGISELLPNQLFYDFPLVTLLINWIGSFGLGWVTIYFLHKKVSKLLQQSISIGLIGSFTTFSTFTVELVQLVNSGHWVMALVYLLLSLWFGLLFAWLGNAIAIQYSNQVAK